MALSKEEILDAIAEMSVIDIVDLIEAMEEKFGVSAAAPVAAAAPADTDAISTTLEVSPSVTDPTQLDTLVLAVHNSTFFIVTL